ncbi:enoyl-CoA hydratase-related protein [Rhodococcus opacus]|nr:enoyl-CoA hydratase-related protein [Rhodococcus opacus]
MDLKVTRFEVAPNGVATVWLTRPDRGNSWTNRMNAEYRWIMQQLDADPAVRVAVVTGEGRQFCVGADTQALDFYTTSRDEYASTVDRSDLERPGHGVRPEFDHDLVWHWGLRLPVIAAINGACAGIGMALVSFCDLRFGAAGAKFTTAAPRLGLPAEYGLAWVLPRLIGLTAASDILLTGRVLTSEQLHTYGYLNDVFPSGEDFLERVRETANHIAEQVSPAAAATTKRQLYADLLHHDVGRAVEHSKSLIGVLMRNPDFKEGVAALAARRTPDFANLDLDWLVEAMPPETFAKEQSR